LQQTKHQNELQNASSIARAIYYGVEQEKNLRTNFHAMSICLGKNMELSARQTLQVINQQHQLEDVREMDGMPHSRWGMHCSKKMRMDRLAHLEKCQQPEPASGAAESLVGQTGQGGGRLDSAMR